MGDLGINKFVSVVTSTSSALNLQSSDADPVTSSDIKTNFFPAVAIGMAFGACTVGIYFAHKYWKNYWQCHTEHNYIELTHKNNIDIVIKYIQYKAPALINLEKNEVEIFINAIEYISNSSANNFMKLCYCNKTNKYGIVLSDDIALLLDKDLQLVTDFSNIEVFSTNSSIFLKSYPETNYSYLSDHNILNRLKAAITMLAKQKLTWEDGWNDEILALLIATENIDVSKKNDCLRPKSYDFINQEIAHSNNNNELKISQQQKYEIIKTATNIMQTLEQTSQDNSERVSLPFIYK